MLEGRLVYFMENPLKFFCDSASQEALEDLYGHDWIRFRFANKDIREDLLPCLDDWTTRDILDMIQFVRAFIVPHAAVSRLCFFHILAINTEVFCTNGNLYHYVLGEVVGMCFARLLRKLVEANGDDIVPQSSFT